MTFQMTVIYAAAPFTIPTTATNYTPHHPAGRLLRVSSLMQSNNRAVCIRSFGNSGNVKNSQISPCQTFLCKFYTFIRGCKTKIELNARGLIEVEGDRGRERETNMIKLCQCVYVCGIILLAYDTLSTVTRPIQNAISRKRAAHTHTHTRALVLRKIALASEHQSSSEAFEIHWLINSGCERLNCGQLMKQKTHIFSARLIILWLYSIFFKVSSSH